MDVRTTIAMERNVVSTTGPVSTTSPVPVGPNSDERLRADHPRVVLADREVLRPLAIAK